MNRYYAFLDAIGISLLPHVSGCCFIQLFFLKASFSIIQIFVIIFNGVNVVVQADAGGSGTVSRRFAGQGGSEHFSMKVPNNKVRLYFVGFFGWYFVG